MGPGPGASYLVTDEGHERSRATGEAATANLVAVGRALSQHTLPVPTPEQLQLPKEDES